MSREFTYDKLVTPPHYEVNCNLFVEDVSIVVSPKFPNLIFSPTNLTNEYFELTEEYKKLMLLIHGPEWLRGFMNFRLKNARYHEIQSTVMNVAAVSVEGQYLSDVSDIRKSAGILSDLARQHDGKYCPIPGMKLVDTKSIGRPLARLHYEFV